MLPTKLALATTLALGSMLAVPEIARACCPDLDAVSPLGWSAEGEVLVRRAVASMCGGSRTAEVMVGGATEPRERFDLYDGSRPLAGGAAPRHLEDEAVYEATEARGLDDPFTPDPGLMRRFPEPVRSLCARDVLVRAFAADSPDGEETPSTKASVWLHTAAGFVQVLDGVAVPRSWSRHFTVYVHPDPDGRRALVRLHHDGPDVYADVLHWIALPEELQEPAQGCEAQAVVVPGRSMPADSWADAQWARSEAIAAVAAAEAGESDAGPHAVYASLEALHADPADDELRALLARALEADGRSLIADAVRASMPGVDHERPEPACDGGPCQGGVVSGSAAEPSTAAGGCGTSSRAAFAPLAVPPFAVALLWLARRRG